MTHIKKIVMQGFKSFPKKIELPFSEGINIILGPNGSGKSNISDAICFVLGRLSIKSMRADKAHNLIFLGSKIAPPSKEARVEIVFDNSRNIFSLNAREVSIERIVRRNGQSIYKINNEVKTRQEILNLLAQRGIDPNGFNIVLQGEIQNFVAMHAEERRKVIEEVSGISVYELRKEKSMKEMEKTEEKLKEVTAVLRERKSYLDNLEKERQQALKFKKLEEDIKKYKASIFYCKLRKKRKEKEKIEFEISKKNQEIEKIKKMVRDINSSVADLKLKIDLINSSMQKSTGLEQEKLNKEIADLRADIAVMNVKLENFERKISDISKQKHGLQKLINDNALLIRNLHEESPTLEKNQKEIDAKKKELEKLEGERKKFYTIKSELKSAKERIQDKNSLLRGYVNESEFFLKQIHSLTIELFDEKTDSKKLSKLKDSLIEKKNILENLAKREKELEKTSHKKEYEIEEQKKLVEKISKIDICPICRNKITKEHIHSINSEVSSNIDSTKKEIEKSDKELSEIYSKKEILIQEIDALNSEILRRESDLIKISNINEKKEQIKVLNEKINTAKNELLKIETRRKSLEKDFDENSNIEQRCEILRIEVQDISLRNKENLNSEILFKQREIEHSKILLKQMLREEEDLNDEIREITEKTTERKKILGEKQKQEEKLIEKFNEMIKERDALHEKVKKNEIELSLKQNLIYNEEQETNELKIDKARIDAELESLDSEMAEFRNVLLIKANEEILTGKLIRAQDTFSRIGSVNLRSLEVYDNVKKEYDLINEKVGIIEKEKEGILRIVHEIDVKKKKTFLQTFHSLNDIFSKNFSQLNTKGKVYLELEDKKEPFNGGIDISVKAGHGKYFNVKSLSGGEQTLVALALIFAIQELKPYPFYLLDEIDAALDKRNSALLASLLKKHTEKGQYVIISHNDEVISNATNLYGVSMHEGVSKIVSLRV